MLSQFNVVRILPSRPQFMVVSLGVVPSVMSKLVTSSRSSGRTPSQKRKRMHSTLCFIEVTPQLHRSLRFTMGEIHKPLFRRLTRNRKYQFATTSCFCSPDSVLCVIPNYWIGGSSSVPSLVLPRVKFCCCRNSSGLVICQ